MKRLGPADYEEAAGILFHKAVLPMTMDDLAGGEEALLKRNLAQSSTYFLMPEGGSLFIFVRLNMASWVAHVAVLPKLRIRSTSLFKQAIAFMFKDTPCQKLIGFVAEYNMPACHLAQACGFRIEGLSTKSWQFRNKLYDRIMFGLSKEEFLCHS